jgi:hypothetical protein
MLFRLCVLMLFLSSCAASMSALSERDPQLDKIGVGAKQHEIENLVGQRFQVMFLNRGQRIEFYRFKEAPPPNMTRSAFHLAFTAGTGGWWELFGVPIEGYNKRERVLAVTYNQRDVAIDIKILEKPEEYEH